MPHHREFLADGGDNPRRQFAQTLIEVFAAFDAPILVYSFYEQRRLKELAGEYPDLSASLDALIAGQLWVSSIEVSCVGAAARHQPHFYSSHLAISRVSRTSILYALRSSHIATAITLAMVELHRALTRLALP